MFMKTPRLVFSFTLLTLVVVCAGQTMAQKKHTMGAASKMTRAQKLAFAMSAAPAEIGRHATVMDMTDMSKPKQLRAGTNGWICYAMILGTNNEAMCLDKQWQNWAAAWMNKTEPKIEGTGIAYMLRGDNGASNTDPYAMGPTADNQWVKSPPHIMVLYSDPKMLDAYPTDPKSGGPWVMWKGTPYAHVMVPVSPTNPATMSSR
jgi:hypothetical protein